MTPEQISLCQNSWQQITGNAGDAGLLFYANLFNADPHLEKLFKGAIHDQGEKLVEMISSAVKLLNDTDKLIPVLQKLGVNHVNYGVKPGDYSSVRTSLLKTLQMVLAEDYSPETDEAWKAAFDLMADTMIEASKAA